MGLFGDRRAARRNESVAGARACAGVVVVVGGLLWMARISRSGRAADALAERLMAEPRPLCRPRGGDNIKDTPLPPGCPRRLPGGGEGHIIRAV